MFNSNFILFVIIFLIVVFILISALKRKKLQRSTPQLKNKNVQIIQSQEYKGRVLKTSGFKIDNSYNSKPYLHKILKDKLTILETAIKEHSKVNFKYLVSDNEKELVFEITPLRIIEDQYVSGKVGIKDDRLFKIEIMNDIKKI